MMMAVAAMKPKSGNAVRPIFRSEFLRHGQTRFESLVKSPVTDGSVTKPAESEEKAEASTHDRLRICMVMRRLIAHFINWSARPLFVNQDVAVNLMTQSTRQSIG